MRAVTARYSLIPAILVGVVLLVSTPRAQDAAADRFWHQWRGPYASGVSKFANPPLEWSEKTNIHWKVEIPGRGSGTPSRTHRSAVGPFASIGSW